jgi:endoglucanase Acf2
MHYIPICEIETQGLYFIINQPIDAANLQRDTMKDAIENLVKDVANSDATDKYSICNRVWDGYNGHSQASGLDKFGEGKSEESTSEAFNTWVVFGQWEQAMDNVSASQRFTTMVRLCAEIAQTFWLLTEDSPYSTEFIRDHLSVGILWDGKVNSEVWWGYQPEEWNLRIQAMALMPTMLNAMFSDDFAQRATPWIMNTIVPKLVAKKDATWLSILAGIVSKCDPTLGEVRIEQINAIHDGGGYDCTLNPFILRVNNRLMT